LQRSFGMRMNFGPGFDGCPTKRCYYETLEVERTAGRNPSSRRHFRKLAMKWHPDKNPGDASSEVRFKEINEAYESSQGRRQAAAAYDRFGHAAFRARRVAVPVSAPAFASSFSDIFEDLFGMGRAARDAAAGASAAPHLRYKYGNHAGRSLPRQDRPDRDSGLSDLRILFGHRRQGPATKPKNPARCCGRRPARVRQAQGFFNAGANLPPAVRAAARMIEDPCPSLRWDRAG